MSHCSTTRSASINATQLGPVPQLSCTIRQRRPSSGYRVGPSSPQYERSQEVSAVWREAMISTHMDLTRKVGAALELTLASRTVLCLLPVGHCPQEHICLADVRPLFKGDTHITTAHHIFTQASSSRVGSAGCGALPTRQQAPSPPTPICCSPSLPYHQEEIV